MMDYLDVTTGETICDLKDSLLIAADEEGGDGDGTIDWVSEFELWRGKDIVVDDLSQIRGDQRL